MYEPADKSDEVGQLKILNVFSMDKREPVIETTEELDDVSRSVTRLGKKKSVAMFADDRPPEAPTTERRYGLRKRCVKAHGKNSDQPGCPTPANTNKQTKSMLRPEEIPRANKDLDRRNNLRKQTVANSGDSNCPTQSKKCKEEVETVLTEEILSCDFCSTVFFSVESLEEHVAEVHVVDNEFQCTESDCTKSFISQERLESHIAEHAKEKVMLGRFKCPICSKIIISDMKKHKMIHMAVKPYKCRLCSESFIAPGRLDIHKMNQHGEPKPFPCPKCPKSYALNHEMEDHLRTHSIERTIACSKCSVMFKTKASLKVHRPKCNGPKPVVLQKVKE